MYVTYGYTEFLVVISIAGFICALGAVFAAIVAGHNRFRLWVRGGGRVTPMHCGRAQTLGERLRFIWMDVRSLRGISFP